MLGFEDLGGATVDLSLWQGYRSGSLDGSMTQATNDACSQPAGQPGACGAVMLTDTKGVFFWEPHSTYDGGSSRMGAARCCYKMITLTGSSIAFGPTYTFDFPFYSQSGGGVRLFRLSGNRVGIFALGRNGEWFGYDQYCVVGVITCDLTNDVLTLGSIYPLGNLRDLGRYVGPMSDAQFMFRNDVGSYWVATISETSVSATALTNGVPITSLWRLDDVRFAAVVDDGSSAYFRVYTCTDATLTQLSSITLNRTTDKLFQLSAFTFVRTASSSSTARLLTIDPVTFGFIELPLGSSFSLGGGSLVTSPDGKALLAWQTDGGGGWIKAVDFSDDVADTGVYVPARLGAASAPSLLALCPTPSGKAAVLLWTEGGANAFLKVIRCAT